MLLAFVAGYLACLVASPSVAHNAATPLQIPASVPGGGVLKNLAALDPVTLVFRPPPPVPINHPGK
jgi:hypothetical protein